MKSLLQQQLNLKKSLINHLDELINITSNTTLSNTALSNTALSNAVFSQTGGKKYSQDELDNLIIETTKHINVLFFQTQIESNAIRNQINELIKVKPYLVDMMDKLGYNIKYLVSEASRQSNQSSQSIQSGGANKKKYNQSHVDKAINNISGQYLSIYIQAENEKQFLANTYSKLLELSELNPFVQIGHIATKSVTKSIHLNPPLFVSLKTLREELTARKILENTDKILHKAVMLSNDKFTITKNNKNNNINIVTRNTDTNDLLGKIFNKGEGPLTKKNLTKTSIDYEVGRYNSVVTDILKAINFSSTNTESIIVENSADALLKLIPNTITIKGNLFKDYINDPSNIGAKEIYDLMNNYIINIAYKENGGLTRTLN